VTVFGSRIAASRLMSNGDVPSKVGFLAVSGGEKVGVDIQNLLLHPDQWVLEALLMDLQVARDSEAVLAAEVVASEADLNNVEDMEAEVVVALVFKEAAASEDKMGMELLRQTPPLALEVLVVVGFLEVEEEVTAVHQIITVLEVGMIRVEEVAHTMTEAVVVGIVATNEMDLPVVALGAIWSR
jgi:hypothetical protein